MNVLINKIDEVREKILIYKMKRSLPPLAIQKLQQEKSTLLRDGTMIPEKFNMMRRPSPATVVALY